MCPTGIIAAVLGSEVEPNQPLMEAGLDSLAAVELRSAIAAAFNITLPATLAFDFPTAAAIAQYIADHVPPAAVETAESADEEALDDFTVYAHHPQDDGPGADAIMILEEESSMSDLLRATTLNLQSIVADIAGQVISEEQPMAEVTHAASHSITFCMHASACPVWKQLRWIRSEASSWCPAGLV